MKNIWYVHPYAGGPGVGRYSRPFLLAQHWAREGARVTIFSASSHHLLDAPQKEGERIIEGVTYEFIGTPGYKGNGLGRLWNMARLCFGFLKNYGRYAARYGAPDVVIASSPHPYIFLATHFVARRFFAKSFFEVRDLWPLSLIELAGVSPKHPLIFFTGLVERFAYSHADRVVSLLPMTADHMISIGMPERKWAYIPNGIDSKEMLQLEPNCSLVEVVNKWKLEGCMVFIYAGALGRPNHVESLIRATKILKEKEITAIKVIIVGRGECESELRSIVKDLALEEDILVCGQIKKSEVVDLLYRVDAGYISLRPEPLFRFGVSPNKLFDYMLAKLPVIFAVKAGNDPVAEAGAGYSVLPGNIEGIALAMEKISLLSEGERTAMGERGRAYVLQRHDYSNLARSYLQLMS